MYRLTASLLTLGALLTGCGGGSSDSPAPPPGPGPGPGPSPSPLAAMMRADLDAQTAR